MGQARSGLFSLLGSRAERLRLLNLRVSAETNSRVSAETNSRVSADTDQRGGKVIEQRIPGSCSGLEAYGEYLLAQTPKVPELWGALHSALTQRQPLVILPPASALEKEVLLRQLPAAPPAGAVLALFTSGTTGEPKAVFHSEATLLSSANQLAAAFPGSEPTACLLPPWGMAGLVFHCLLPAARGSHAFYSEQPLLEWAAGAGEYFRELDIGLVTLNPFVLDLLLRAGLGPAWQGKIVSLTAPLSTAVKELCRQSTGRAALEIYGMTEAAGPVLLEGRSLGAHTRLSASQELELEGEQLFLGYGSAGKFTARLPAEWFATGDVFVEQNGKLAHSARIRELIDIGGRKIAPALVEAAFTGMSELAEGLAFAKVLAGVERVGFVYARAKSCSLSEEALGEAVLARAEKLLSKELRPAWIQEMEKVPRLKNGKPDRKSLK